DDVPPLRLRARRRAQELLLRDQRGRARDVGPRRRPTVVRRPAGGDRGGSAGHDDDRRRAPPVTVILGIETSCDETAAAVVRDGREVLSSVVSSQIDLHARFGGVVPEIASRAHVELLTPVTAEALVEAGVDERNIDAVAATIGPGL